MENEFDNLEGVSQEQNASVEPLASQMTGAENGQQASGGENSAAGGEQEVFSGVEPQRFEPSSEYRWVRPEPVEVPQKPKKTRKNRGILKKVLSVVLVIALAVGCSALGAAAGIQYMKQKQSQDGKTPLDRLPHPGNNDGDSDVFEGDRGSTVIDINMIDTTKLMSAAEVYALNVNSTVGITTSITTNYWGYSTTSAASGSGFVYSDDGYIITNYHVVENSDAISVSLYDGTSLDAKLIGYDESNDVAVLKVEAENLTPVILGDSNNLNVGDPVVAIGNPLGELTFSLTSGAVSALDREVTFSGGITMNLIQTDCAINSGNSGGALFNLYGEVIGITNAKYSGNSSSGATIDNIGFAIPMNRVRSIIDSIIENGFVVKPYIGVTIADVSEEAQGYGLPAGASIQGVVEDSPAEKAGLKKNDIVTQINGEKIEGASDLKSYVSASKPGDELKLQVWRRGETLELTLTVGEQTQEALSQQNQQPQQNTQIPVFPDFGWGY